MRYIPDLPYLDWRGQTAFGDDGQQFTWPKALFTIANAYTPMAQFELRGDEMRQFNKAMDALETGCGLEDAWFNTLVRVVDYFSTKMPFWCRSGPAISEFLSACPCEKPE
jgi:hypothetical protein